MRLLVMPSLYRKSVVLGRCSPVSTGIGISMWDAAMKHPEIGQWLRQGDTMFLTPGWEHVARTEFRNRRGALGLALENVAGIAGSATMQTHGLEVADDGEDINTSFESNAYVLRMKEGVDWKSVGEALDKDQLHTAMEGLSDIVSAFFEDQTDPHQLRLPNKDAKESPATAPQIPAMWTMHSGDMATLIFRVPEFSGHTESPFQNLTQNFHELAGYVLVGIKPFRDAEQRQAANRNLPARDSAVKLARNVKDLLDAAAVKLREAPRDEEFEEELTAALLDHIKQCKPLIIVADHPGQTSTVIIDVDLPATLLWHISTV